MTAATPRLALPPTVAALTPWVDAGVLGTTDVEITAAVIAALAPDSINPADPDGLAVMLALALAVRAPLHGHMCVDLAVSPPVVITDDSDPGDSPAVDNEPVEDQRLWLAWPEPDAWLAAVAASPLCQVVAGATATGATATGATATGDTPEARPVAPLIINGTRCYLQRSWHDETVIAHTLNRLAGVSPVEPGANLTTQLDGGGPEAGGPEAGGPDDDTLARLLASERLSDRQKLAVETALERRLTVLTGGPGTGKTHTVARMLAALTIANPNNPPEVALAAPTGKAAARLAESIAAAIDDLSAELHTAPTLGQHLLSHQPRTIHRLLGSRGRNGFTHHPGHPLTADIVVVDEASMVSASLMARLVESLRPDARLVLVGDPDQLTSVEAGAVLADVVGAATEHPDGDLARSVVRLEGSHRFGPGSQIAQLADAIRVGHSDDVIEILRTGTTDGGSVRWVGDELTPDDQVLTELAAHARSLRATAADGAAAAAVAELTKLAVLCATRRGPHGVMAWNTWAEAALLADSPQATAATTPARLWARRQPWNRDANGLARWYRGRPVQITTNDYVNGLFNGDVGVVVSESRSRQVAFADDAGVRLVDPGRVGDVTTMWATTIHKSQGSEYDHVVVVLPDRTSPLLTRQLLYTAVTRARTGVTVVGSAAVIEQAITTQVARASGLTARLQ